MLYGPSCSNTAARGTAQSVAHLYHICSKDKGNNTCQSSPIRPQRHKNLKLSGQQLFTRKNFPDEARKYTSHDI